MLGGNNAGHEGADAAGNITLWDMQEQIHKEPHANGADVHAGPAFARCAAAPIY
jgi:hypothetical protein